MGTFFFLPVSSLNQVGDSMTGYNGWRLLSQGFQKKTKNQTYYKKKIITTGLRGIKRYVKGGKTLNQRLRLKTDSLVLSTELIS